VWVKEGLNARALSAADLPPDLRTFDLITIDVSFISLRHILPVLPPLLAPAGAVIALVKPQFEARREEVGKGGIVRDTSVHTRVVAEVTAAADALGLERSGLIDSPITGMEGNREFLLWLRPRPHDLVTSR
jgi:23S rRNA (cytidine1920-2'-O)/16S rRNA (cytidine1409-2'-O)-methyltransferase